MVPVATSSSQVAMHRVSNCKNFIQWTYCSESEKEMLGRMKPQLVFLSGETFHEKISNSQNTGRKKETEKKNQREKEISPTVCTKSSHVQNISRADTSSKDSSVQQKAEFAHQKESNIPRDKNSLDLLLSDKMQE
ncbi:hypothetical protein CDAR_85341 [Caerostris darwini]|uniref:Uncharacterized protein n=1 Tax=Caerostris darwini TaxID=1538125 RepID=A0AAV4UI25_9ARAC|nr:hypothetical protein CDAR_85341 [Caerostris darwini]